MQEEDGRALARDVVGDLDPRASLPRRGRGTLSLPCRPPSPPRVGRRGALEDRLRVWPTLSLPPREGIAACLITPPPPRVGRRRRPEHSAEAAYNDVRPWTVPSSWSPTTTATSRRHPGAGRGHAGPGRGGGGGARGRAERGLPRHLPAPARCASRRSGRAGSRWTARPPTAPTSPSTTSCGIAGRPSWSPASTTAPTWPTT